METTIEYRAYKTRSRWTKRVGPVPVWGLALLLAIGLVAATGAYLGRTVSDDQALEELVLAFGVGPANEIDATYSFAAIGTPDFWNYTTTNTYSTAQSYHLEVRIATAGGFTSCASVGLTIQYLDAATLRTLTGPTLASAKCVFHFPATFGGTAAVGGPVAGFPMRHTWTQFPNGAASVTFEVQPMLGTA